MTTLAPGPLDLALAASLVLGSAAASLALQLRLAKPLLWGSARMVLQLLLVGLVLRLVFAAASPLWTAGVALLMLAATAREVATRPVGRLRGGGNYRIGAAAVGVPGVATVVLALLTVIRPVPWFDPRYAIPLLGIVLGSVLNAASLGLDAFLSAVVAGRDAIEARLALGAGIREALAPPLRESVRRGLIPIVNQMSAAGIITLPGIMTGQLLAGMDPLDAARYQVLLLFLLAGAGALAAAVAVFLAARALTDERQRLRLDRLHGP